MVAYEKGQPVSVLTVTPLSPMFLTRCRMAAQRLRSGKKQAADKELQEIGRRVRIWRIQTGKSRTALAQELGTDADQLLFLEMGDGLPEDITEQQLNQLAAMIDQSWQDTEFSQLVQRYLARLSSNHHHLLFGRTCDDGYINT